MVGELGEDTQPVVESNATPVLYSFGWLFPDELIQLGQQALRTAAVLNERTNTPALNMPGAWRD